MHHSVHNIDLQILHLQQQLVLENEALVEPFSPIQDYTLISNTTKEVGEEALRQGKVGAIILAGGLGSRFGQEKPKGTFAISCIKQKSLFQLIAERVIAAEKKWGIKPKLAIMTSDMTHDDTIEFFRQNNFFGLAKDDIDFFLQGSLPELDDAANLVTTKTGQILTAPDGNGAMFWHMHTSGVLQKWKNAGIAIVTCLVVDNPLADPFCPELIGFHQLKENDASVVTILRENPQEKLGVLVTRNDHLAVVEYSEIPALENSARNSHGVLLHPLGNISYFAFSISFIERLSLKPCKLPLHKAKKNTTLQQNIELGIQSSRSLWKFEYFIFDVLAYTKKCKTLVIPRNECFAPLKNAQGDASPETVKQALLERDRRIIKQITTQDPPVEITFELSVDFLYPTDELMQRWRGKTLEKQTYIEAD